MISSIKSGQVSFKLLEVIHAAPNRPIYYRILVGSRVQYLRAPKPLSGFPDNAGRFLGFSTVPDGDWDVASLEEGEDGKLQVVSTKKQRFPDATDIWHPAAVNMIDLAADIYNQSVCDEEGEVNMQCVDRYLATVFECPTQVGAPRAIGVWDLHPTDPNTGALAQESYIYSLLPPDQTITPQFMGHITDNGQRVIGFILELVPTREANIEDAQLCIEALAGLHRAGIAHGNLHRSAFLIREDGPVKYAQVQHFHMSYENRRDSVFQQEVARVEEVLRQESVKAQRFETSEELSHILERDRAVHPALLTQFQEIGRIIVTEEEHKDMLMELEIRDWKWDAVYVRKSYERLEENGGHWFKQD